MGKWRDKTIIDGYDLTELWIRDVTDGEIVAALKAAGITPDEFNAPDEAPRQGLMPEARLLFKRGSDGVFYAWRVGEDAPEPCWERP